MTPEQRLLEELLRSIQKKSKEALQYKVILDDPRYMKNKHTAERLLAALASLQDLSTQAHILSKKISQRVRVYKDGFDWITSCSVHGELLYAGRWVDAMVFARGHVSMHH